MNWVWQNILAFSIPRHSTVDGKVDGVAQKDHGVDEENNVLGHLVVHELVHTEHRLDTI